MFRDTELGGSLARQFRARSLMLVWRSLGEVSDFMGESCLLLLKMARSYEGISDVRFMHHRLASLGPR